MFRSYGGPTHRNVTSPRDRKMTSHHYSPRRTPLPSPTADPAPEALLTRSQFPTLSRQFIATMARLKLLNFFDTASLSNRRTTHSFLHMGTFSRICITRNIRIFLRGRKHGRMIILRSLAVNAHKLYTLNVH